MPTSFIYFEKVKFDCLAGKRNWHRERRQSIPGVIFDFTFDEFNVEVRHACGNESAW